MSGLPRVQLAAGTLPPVLRPFTWSDLLATYVERGLSGGRWPYFDVAFEYPPLIGYPAGFFAQLAPDAAAYLFCWAAVVVVAGGVTGLLLARESGSRTALLRWVLAPQVVLYAGMNMDLVPVSLTVGAVVLARRGRATLAVAMLAIGGAAKLFPALAMPTIVARDPRRWLWLFGAFAVTIGAVFAPSVLASHSSLAGVAYYASGYEAGGIAVWGLARAALDGLGVPGGGMIVLFGTTIGLVLTYLLGVVPRARAAADPAVGIGLAIVAVLLWSRLYSPQFSLWLVPFFALLPRLRSRTFALLAVADTVVFIGVSQLTLVQRDPFDSATTAYVIATTVAVVLRHVALLWSWRDLARSHPTAGADAARGAALARA